MRAEPDIWWAPRDNQHLGARRVEHLDEDERWWQCSLCGCPVEDIDRYCRLCGARIEEGK